jgi:hypothetical protein
MALIARGTRVRAKVSAPASGSAIGALWRSMCGDTRFRASDRHGATAVVA